MKTLAQTTHESVAKTLRYCGYSAKCVNNTSEAQPYEVHIKGIEREELNSVTDMIWNMHKDFTINIISK